ncbi:hypothetical protein LTR85_006466 [Meristemomyces frigidus]|nr:hypothetical protein LTR85_006466 [Meristemomyces frigidus]
MSSKSKARSVVKKIGQKFKDAERAAPAAQVYDLQDTLYTLSGHTDTINHHLEPGVQDHTEDRKTTASQPLPEPDIPDGMRDSAQGLSGSLPSTAHDQREAVHISQMASGPPGGRYADRAPVELSNPRQSSPSERQSSDGRVMQLARVQNQRRPSQTRSAGGGGWFGFSQVPYQQGQPSRDELQEIKYLQNKVRRREQTLKDQNDIIISLEEAGKVLQQEKGQIEGQLRMLEEELRQLQERSFKSMEDARWVPFDEGTIQDEMLGLRGAIDRHAKAYGMKDFSGLERGSEAVNTALLTELSAIFQFKQREPVRDLNALREISAVPYAARLCLAGLISNAVHAKLLGNPFFFMDDDFEDADADFKAKLSHFVAQDPVLAGELLPSRSFFQFYETIQGFTEDVASFDFDYEGRGITLIDTPGFNDTTKSEAEVLKAIADWLDFTYRNNNIKLNGIVYLQNIQEPRITGSSLRNLKMFKDLCGESPMKNVILVTTRWGLEEKSGRIGHAEEHEEQYRSEFWTSLISRGARMERFRDTKESALEILLKLVDRPAEVLQIQTELVDNGKDLIDTAAGNTVNEELVNLQKKYQGDVAQIQKEMLAALADKDLEVQEALLESKRTFERRIERLREEQDLLQYERRNDARRMRNDMNALQNELQRKYSQELDNKLGAQHLGFEETAAKLLADKSKLRREQAVVLQDKIDDMKKQPKKERTGKKLLLSLLPVLGTVAMSLIGIPLGFGPLGGLGC